MLDFYLRRILLHSACMREYGNPWPWNCVVPKLRVAYTPISAFAMTIQFPWKTIDAKAIDDSSTISCSEDANETTTPRSRTRNPVLFFSLSLSSQRTYALKQETGLRIDSHAVFLLAVTSSTGEPLSRSLCAIRK